MLLLAAWAALGLALVMFQRPGRSSGLPLAYFLGLSLIHVPGALLYVGEVDASSNARVTSIGFEQTIIGIAAFVTGVLVAKYRFGRIRSYSTSNLHEARGYWKVLDKLAVRCILFGAAVYFIIMPFTGGIPSISAVLSALGSLVIVGACLRIWIGKAEDKPGKAWSALALLPLLPLGTVLQGGFIGFGLYWSLVIVCFFFAQSGHRTFYISLAPVVLFAGLSFWVTYAAGREQLRQLVWYEQAGIEQRLQQIGRILESFEWLDLSNEQHRRAIDLRLNQNYFVGLAVERLGSGDVEFALGSTPGNLFLALIPRAIWPDKPAVGGGGTIVSDFTGLRLAEGTSFGAGQVLEFYVNFGTTGVVIGFLCYGIIFGYLDVTVMNGLWSRGQREFMSGFLISLALLQPGGNLLEIFIAVISGGIVAYGIGTWAQKGLEGWRRTFTG